MEDALWYEGVTTSTVLQIYNLSFVYFCLVLYLLLSVCVHGRPLYQRIHNFTSGHSNLLVENTGKELFTVERRGVSEKYMYVADVNAR